MRVLGPVFAAALAVELFIATLGSALKGVSGKGAPYVSGFGTPRHIGTLFLTKYLFPFEVASLLLMVAAIGAVVLARRRRGLEGEGSEGGDYSGAENPRPAYTGTMAEAAGLSFAVEEIREEYEEQRRENVGAGAPHREKGGW
jgi:hypothetical protein